jgi:CRP-like cAMP-binding protein
MSAEYSDDDSVPPIPPTPPKQKKKGGKEEEKGGIPDLQPNSDLEIKYGRQKYRPVAKRDPRVGYSQPLRRIDTAQAKTTAAKYDRRQMFPKWMTLNPDFKTIFQTPMLPEDVGIRKLPENRTNVDHNALGNWLRRHPLFTRFSLSRCKEISKIAKLKDCHDLKKPFAAHSNTRNHLYIVHEGGVAVRSPELGYLGVLKKGDSIGYVEGTPATFKMAASHSTEYNVELIADCPGTSVVILKRTDYRSRMTEFLELEVFKNMKFFEKEVSLFKDWTLGRILVFARQVKEWNVAEGEYIVRQGEDADCLFFVRAGKVAVQKRIRYKKTNTIPTPDGFVDREVMVDKSVEVCQCPMGDFFGHQAMLDGAASYVSAVALQNVQLLVVAKEVCFSMFGFRGTMEKLRLHAQKFMSDEQIIATLEDNIRRKYMYEEAIAHVPEGVQNNEERSTLMTFEAVMDQPLAHSIHGKERKAIDLLGHHFDIHRAVASKRAKIVEAERKRKIRVQSGELVLNNKIFESMKGWGKKGKARALQRRKSMVPLRQTPPSSTTPKKAADDGNLKMDGSGSPIRKNAEKKKKGRKKRLQRRNSVMF